MNCTNCNAPLPPDARFCRNCGAQVSINNPARSDTASSQPNHPLTAYNAPTSFTMPTPASQSPQPQQTWAQPQQAPQLSQQPWILPQSQSPQAPQPSQFQAQAPTSAQQPYYQPTIPVPPGTMQSTGSANQRPQTFAPGQDMPTPPVRRRRGRGLIITLITLIVLIIVLVGAWIFALRPYLHTLAQNQIDSTLTGAENQIDFSPLSKLPPGVPLPPVQITEDTLNNSLVAFHDPSSPVQNMHVQITTTEVRFDFTVYGFACDVTGEPALVNGKLTATNINVGGIAGLIMSPDEITGLLNNHLADIQARLNRPITSVTLMNQEIDLTLS